MTTEPFDLADAVLIDLEATGTDPALDRVTQIAVRTGCALYERLVNPGRPIPQRVTELTGITDAAVAGAPPFEAIAAEVAELVRGRPLVGFGVAMFDKPLLAEEFERAGVAYSFGPVIDAGVIFRKHEPRTLAAAVKFYLGEELLDAHTAGADAVAAGRVLAAQLARYGLGAKSVEELAALSVLGEHPPADPANKLVRINGEVCFNTFKNRHVPVRHDIGYAEWMLRMDFPLATKRVLEAEVDRYYHPPATKAERVEELIAEAMAGDGAEIPF